MSSFKRKSTTKTPTLPIGTRPCPSSSLTPLTSTGIASLDDILGGGLPLSCSLLLLAPDPHSAYGDLAQKYFIAQGLACGQNVCVVDENAREIVQECMWMTGGTAAKPSTALEDRSELPSHDDDKIKIAWRYDQMKQFQTTVPISSVSSQEDYCHSFDLTCRILDTAIEMAIGSGQLLCLAVGSTAPQDRSAATTIISLIENVIQTRESGPPSVKPLRICIPALGSPQWGDLNSQDILHFLHSLRALLRQYPNTCAAISLSPHLCTDTWGGAGYIQKLGWLSDAALTLAAFAGNPSLSLSFPSHHGLLHIHTLPAPSTILPPSDKFSTLRALSSSGASVGGSGENNLAFKCTRKRLIFETLHLDVEGGVGERRTTPSTTAGAMETGIGHGAEADGAITRQERQIIAEAAVEVKLEIAQKRGKGVSEIRSGEQSGTPVNEKPARAKKRVLFQSDRPDLYDF